MIELPDDELDKLFRKSSEELDPQYDQEDWDSLKKRLDQHDGRTGGAWFRKWWPLGLGLLLLTVGVATYLWKNANFRNAENEKAQTITINQQSEQASIAKPEIKTENGAAEAIHSKGKSGQQKSDDQAQTKVSGRAVSQHNSQIKILSNLKKDNPGTAGKNGNYSKPYPKSGLQTVAANSRSILPRSRSKAGGVYLEPNRSKTEGGDGALILSEKEVVAEEVAGNGSEEPAIQESESRMQLPASILENRQASWNYGGSKPEITFTKTEPESKPAPQQEEVQQAKWAVRFGYSPDLSTVGWKNFTKPGTAVSLLAELSVLPRLFVQTGAVWSRKDYFAGAESYILPSRWGYKPRPESIDGVCKVLEIPLNLRYDIVSGRRSRFFIGSGVSSYYMLNEKYQYNYKYPKDPHIEYTEWQGTTGWYFLSHLNASAGYEYRISSKLSLLGEPYARVPLKRVGYGKVNLVTMGFWLSMRYTPAFR